MPSKPKAHINEIKKEFLYKKKLIIPYEERISAIEKFFGISTPAATFIYHRKRRGHPFKTPTDDKYIEWNIKIQNALVKADECIGWDWDEVHFGKELHALAQHDIHVDKQSSTEVYKHDKKEDSEDGWTVAKNTKKEKYQYKKTLQFMGFIQRHPKSKYSKKLEAGKSRGSDSSSDSEETDASVKSNVASNQKHPTGHSDSPRPRRPTTAPVSAWKTAPNIPK